jgi:hypothetical protein
VKAKIYVAAPSRDLSRYRAFIGRAEYLGLHNTHDWAVVFDAAREQGLTDATITAEYARNAALADAVGVRECSVFVLLAPRPGEATIGAWVELGIALGLRTSRASRKPLIVVCSAERVAIFEELADVCVRTDDDALNAAFRLAFSMELEEPQGLDLEELAAAMAVEDGASP